MAAVAPATKNHSYSKPYHPIPQPKPHPLPFPKKYSIQPSTLYQVISLPPTPLQHPSIHSSPKKSTTAIHLSTPQNIQSSPPRNRLRRRFQILLCNFNISKHRDLFERQNSRLHDEFVTEICEYYNGDVDVGGYEGFGTPAVIFWSGKISLRAVGDSSLFLLTHTY